MFRTPAKKDMNETMTLRGAKDEGEPSPNVRKSIGEWESGSVDIVRKSVTPPKRPQAAAPIKKIPAIRGLSAEKAVSPPKLASKTSSDPVAEARQLSIRIKQHMWDSRNIKREIKTGVLEATERLYQIVKQLGGEKGQGDQKQETALQASKVVPEKHEELKSKDEERDKREKELEGLIKNQTELIKENSEKLEHLRKIIEEKATTTTDKESENVRPPQKALHSMVISSADFMNTSDIMMQLRKRASEDEGWIRVEKVRKGKDKKVIMGYKTEEERRKAKERIQEIDKNLVIEEIQNKDPLIVAYGVLKLHKDEDILKAIRNKNKDIFKNLNKEDDRIEIKYKKRARNPHTHHVVMKTSPEIWRRALKQGTLHIDIQPVRVADQSPLVQCTRCLGFGHSKRFCREGVVSCSHCGGAHLRGECAEWLAGTEPSCKNCKSAKHEQVEHNAFSEDCPIRKRWDLLARSAVAYC